MAASTTTSTVYIHVIEDVISKIRDEFVNNGGPGDSVLNELQGIWETKMIQAGVIFGPIDRSSAQKPTPGPMIPVHDLNVPYEGNEEYETPTAEMLFPPTPLQTPAPTPFPGNADNSMYNYPTPASENCNNTDVKGPRPSPYMRSPSPRTSQRSLSVDVRSPSPWTSQRSLSVDVNVAPTEGREDLNRIISNQSSVQELMMSSGKRKRDDFSEQYMNSVYTPQQDGAGGAVAELNEGDGSPYMGSTDNHSGIEMQSSLTKSSIKIPQMDGHIPDIYDEMLSTPNIYSYQGCNEDYNIANTSAPNDAPARTPVAAQNEAQDVEDDDEILNEDDDDDDLDDIDDEEDMNTHHLVLAQFDKVTRTKSRWKCTLKDGIMHINNKDILFNKATGEFDF